MPERSLSGAARRGVRWTALGTLGSAVLQLLQVAVLARLLMPEDFGRMALLLVLLTIGSAFSEFGFSSAIIQRRDVQRRELATLYAFNLVAGAALFVLIWLCAPMISSLMNVGEMTGLIRGAALVFLISPWGLQFQALLQKRLRFGVLAAANLAAVCSGTVGAIALALGGAGVWALLGGVLVTRAVLTTLLIAVAVREGLWSGLAWDLPGVRGYLVFGGLRLAATLANAINSRIDLLAIGASLGAGPLGLYNVAQRVALEPSLKLNPIVTRVAFPIFSLAQDQPERVRRGYLRMNGLLLGVNAPLLLGLAATAPLAVPVVLGPEWEEATLLIQILALYALLRSIGSAAGPVLIAKGRADWSLYWDCLKLLVVPVTIWLVAWWAQSIAAVCWALLILQVILLIVHYFALVRRLVGACGLDYLVSIGRPVLPALLMAGVVWQFDRLLTAVAPLPRLIALVLVGCGAYLGLSMLFQREALRELVAVVAMRKPWVERPSAD